MLVCRWPAPASSRRVPSSVPAQPTDRARVMRLPALAPARHGGANASGREIRSARCVERRSADHCRARLAQQRSLAKMRDVIDPPAPQQWPASWLRRHWLAPVAIASGSLVHCPSISPVAGGSPTSWSAPTEIAFRRPPAWTDRSAVRPIDQTAVRPALNAHVVVWLPYCFR